MVNRNNADNMQRDSEINEFDAAGRALHRGLSFALYRGADTPGIIFLCSSTDEKRPPLSQRRFLLSPWNTRYSEAIVIDDRMTAAEVLNAPLTGSPEISEPLNSSTDYSQYIRNVSGLVAELQTTGGKTVISRTIATPVENLTEEAISQIVREFFEDNPHAHCAFFGTSTIGYWLVATPEILIDARPELNMFTTMSLAGTRPAHQDSLLPWDEKNRQEQAIVTDFITDTLHDMQIRVTAYPPVTLRANAVEHICTHICGELQSDDDIPRIIDALNPTPAVCGFPRDISLRRIADIEEHTRRMYGGWFAFDRGDRCGLTAMVVLRCTQLSQHRLCIYAGGGITGMSDPDKEWQETMLKSSALVSLFRLDKCMQAAEQ